MKLLLLFAAAATLLLTPAMADRSSDEVQVRSVVESFYGAFNQHDFKKTAEFTADEWTHINPFGGVTYGRDAVLAELNQVHSSFLKGVTDTPEMLSVKFATPDAAVVTVTSRVSSFTTPDGVKHENEQHVRTFIVVKRARRWLIFHDQNTIRRR